MLSLEQQKLISQAFPNTQDWAASRWYALADSDNALCVHSSAKDEFGRVWRIPKSPEIANRTTTELALLEFLNERKLGSFRTPRVLSRSTMTAGHTLTFSQGTVLSREMLADQENSQLHRALRQSFKALMSELGTVLLPDHLLTVMPHEDPFDGPKALRALNLPEVFPQYAWSIKEALFWADAADKAALIGLMHNDVAHGNLILDEVGNITTVIDWTNAYIGPRYREYRQLTLVAPHLMMPFLSCMRTVTRLGIAATAFLRGIRLLHDEPTRELRIFEAERARDLFNRFQVLQ